MRFIFSFFCIFFLCIQSAIAGVDINTATASELTTLSGVGPKTAEKIIAYREANGPFASCDQLTSVKGIGAKTLAKIKPQCVTGDGESTQASPSTPAPQRKSTSAPANANTVDINTASASQLRTLPGVGPKTAEKIIAYREANGPFASCDQITNVKGIGAKTLAKIKPTCSASAAE